MKQLVRKTFRHLLLFITVSLFFPRLLLAQNLVTNGGFDLVGGAGTGWTTSCSIEINRETVYGGGDGNNRVTEIDIERCIRQNICVAGGAYTISLKASRRIAGTPPASPGFTISVTGVTTGTTYLSQNTTRDNTSWALTTETYTFTIPSGSPDKYVTLAFVSYNNTTSGGLLLDDIEMHPQPDMMISGITILGILNATYDFSVANILSDIFYTWNFDAGATPATSASATPSVNWVTNGTKTISVAISNGTCTLASLNTTLLIAGVLPLSFTRFTGNVIDDKAALTWTTVNENNTDFFMVERSADGVHYNSIAQVPGNNKPGTHSYSYIDTKFTSPGYYRLKEVDLNGDNSFSPVIILKKTTNGFALKLYPSTASTIITYVATINQPAMAMVQVMNAAGQTIDTHFIQLFQGMNEQKLDVSNLSRGQYFFKLTIPTNSSSIIKQFTKH